MKIFNKTLCCLLIISITNTTLPTHKKQFYCNKISKNQEKPRVYLVKHNNSQDEDTKKLLLECFRLQEEQQIRTLKHESLCVLTTMLLAGCVLIPFFLDQLIKTTAQPK